MKLKKTKLKIITLMKIESKKNLKI